MLYQNYLINFDFQSFFEELSPTLPDFSLSICFFRCIFIYEFYSVKPSHFTETKIYVKLEPINANLAHSSYLPSAIIFSQWNYLS